MTINKLTGRNKNTYEMHLCASHSSRPSPQGVTWLRKHKMWIPLVQEIFLPPIFLKITQELTDNDAFDGEENGRWGWVKNLFCLPIVLPSLQGVTQLRKCKLWISLVQEIFLPPIFLEIAQELTENDAFYGEENCRLERGGGGCSGSKKWGKLRGTGRVWKLMGW